MTHVLYRVRPLFGKKYVGLWKWLALMGILLVGAFLRFYQLDYKSLWVDEIIQVELASGSFLQTIQGMRTQIAAPPLDYLITWLMLQTGKNGAVTSEFVLRFPPLVAGILTIPFGFALAKRVTGSLAVALTTAYLIALAPLLIRFSQEVRFYSLSVLTMVAVAYFFVRAWQQPNWKNWLVFGAALVVAFFTHYYVGLVLAALLLFGAGVVAVRMWRTHAVEFTPALRTRLLLGTGAVVLSVVVAAAWLMYALPTQARFQMFMISSLPELIGEPLTSGHVSGKAHLLAVRVLGLAVFPALALLGVAVGVITKKTWTGAVALIVLLGVGGVLLLDWAFYYFFTSRQLLFVVPFYVILISIGIVAAAQWLAKKSRIVGILTAVVVLTGVTWVFALSMRAYYDWPKDDWRTAALFLKQATAVRPAILMVSPATLRGYLAYYEPALDPALRGSAGQTEAAQPENASRVWMLSQDGRTPVAFDVMVSNGWNVISIDASPAIRLLYGGPVPTTQLWREVLEINAPAQVLIYSDILEQSGVCVSANIPLIAHARAALTPPTQPPLLEAQRGLLRRKLRRLC